ncbi:tannase and feruloyl esterase [Stipitochalara longipes BDJ]|nr:tannase and feruloyl esterase [Stipitochalara longipes BDJ]
MGVGSLGIFLRSLLLPWTAEALICSPSAIPYPTLNGAEFLSLTATEIYNHSVLSAWDASNFPPFEIDGLHFCNVSLTYTHPGQDDNINVHVWLPMTHWNGRFQGTGGGGFATGMFDSMLAVGVSQGYSAAATDGGHFGGGENMLSAAKWALLSPGNVNLYALQNFAHVALNDMTIIGKAVTESFYGAAPKYSYWNGCSTGGRQGIMMAQRYPDAYHGILAAAPAINFEKLILGGYWAQFVMNRLGVYPSECEMEAIANATVKACDKLDGVEDGIIAAPGLCNFHSQTLIGKEVRCKDDSTVKISDGAVAVAEETWKGATSATGKHLHPGLTKGTPFRVLAGTKCHDNGTCFGTPFPMAPEWISYFIKKDPDFDATTITTQKEWDKIFHASVQEHNSMIGTDDPDLSEFRDAGGKMITWHGIADPLVLVNGTSQYYEQVEKLDPDVRNYYRYFEAPGVWHCGGGKGAFPSHSMDALVRWVEHGGVPDVLAAETQPVGDEDVRKLNLCPYPLVAAYQGGDTADAKSYACKESFS